MRDMLTPADRYAGLALDTLHETLRRQHNDTLSRRGFVQVLREFGATRDGDIEAFRGRLAGSRTAGAESLAGVVRSAITTADVWDSPDFRRLAGNYLAGLREVDAIEALRRWAISIPETQSRVLLASGAIATEVLESYPKAVGTLAFDEEPAPLLKVCALLVASQELFASGDPAATRLIEAELQKAVIRSGNRAVLDSLPAGNIASSTGSAIGDLAATLSAAGDDNRYVVLAARSVVRELAIASEGRMGPGGGLFAPDVLILPIDADSGSSRITAIPASQTRLTDMGVSIRHAGHADIDFAQTPTTPAAVVNLWQTNCAAVMVERHVRLAFGAAPGVMV